MKSKITLLLSSIALLFSGCAPSASGPTASGDAPKAVEGGSENLEISLKHLDLGAEVFLYLDIDGDTEALAAYADEILVEAKKAFPEIEGVDLDLNRIFELLGLDAITTLGFSSLEIAPGNHRYKSFIGLDGAPEGLLALYGTEAAPFKVLNEAPAGSDYLFEYQISIANLYKALERTAGALPGVGLGWNQVMYQKIPEMDTTWASLLSSLELRLLGWLELGEGSTPLTIEGQTVEVPEFSFKLRLEGLDREKIKLDELVGPMLRPAPDAPEGWLGFMVPDTEDLRQFMELAFAIEEATGHLVIVSNPEMVPTVDAADPISEDEAFAELFSEMPSKGLAMAYGSSEFFTAYIDFISTISAADPDFDERALGIMKAAIGGLVGGDNPSPVISVYTVVDEGLYGVAHQPVSPKVAFAAFPVGFVAAMAIPAFEKVRTTSQESAITNNLRQLATAADIYFLENGVNEVLSDELIGPDAFIDSLEPVAGEVYLGITIRSDFETIEVTTADGRTISYGF